MALFREKIALVFFSALILLGLGVLVGYLALGHSWNVAASNIDDAAGSMTGYTTILYQGTVPEPTAKDTSGKTATGTNGSKPLAGSDDAKQGVSSAQKDLSKEGSLPQESSSDEGFDLALDGQDEASQDSLSGEPANAAAESQTKESESTSDRRTEDDGVVPTEDDEAGLPEDGAGEGLDGLGGAPLSGPEEKKKPLLELKAVEKSYLDKNATVFTIDTVAPSQYREGIILMKGGHRFGVFSIAPTDTTFRIERQVSYFQKHAVDFIVAITPDMQLVEQVNGIDIVISTQDEGLFIMGETIEDTFYVSTPTIGSIGAILISPSNVVSAKAISEL